MVRGCPYHYSGATTVAEALLDNVLSRYGGLALDFDQGRNFELELLK